MICPLTGQVEHQELQLQCLRTGDRPGDEAFAVLQTCVAVLGNENPPRRYTRNSMFVALCQRLLPKSNAARRSGTRHPASLGAKTSRAIRGPSLVSERGPYTTITPPPILSSPPPDSTEPKAGPNMATISDKLSELRRMCQQADGVNRTGG